MNRIKRISLVLCFILVACIFLPLPAAADNDDFEVEFGFSPEPIGYLGGEAQLILTITNTGTTDINRVDIVIITEEGFSQTWEGAPFAPGTDLSLAYALPLRASDLDTRKILQVSINNGVSRQSRRCTDISD